MATQTKFRNEVHQAQELEVMARAVEMLDVIAGGGKFRPFYYHGVRLCMKAVIDGDHKLLEVQLAQVRELADTGIKFAVRPEKRR